MKKSVKRTKNTTNHKHTKSHNHITCCSSDRMRTSFLQIFGYYCSFTRILAQKIKMFKIWRKKNKKTDKKRTKKTRSDIIILHKLRCVSNAGVRDFSKFNKKGFKINVGVRVFQRNINHSFSIVWCNRATSDEKKKNAFLFSEIVHVTKMLHDDLFLK